MVSAIKDVVQRANQEQQQAFASGDPTVMKDTATGSYYRQAAQGLNDLANAGVTAIKLENLQWGDISLQGPATVRATTLETWSTTFTDGSTLRETDTNVYTLVGQGGSWLIQEDQHPDTRQSQPPGSTASATPPASDATAPSAADQSRNWAGYSATGGDFTAVSASWTVPTVGTGTAPAADATWVGIGGVDTTDLIQAGTDATVESGQVVYSAWVETLPQVSRPVPLNVAAGDRVSVSLTQQSDGTWEIVITDDSSGQSYRTNVTYRSSLSSAEWVEETPEVGRRVMLPLDDFGAIAFTSASTVENGQQRTIAQANGKPITLNNRSGQALAVPSKLGADGTSFTVSRTTIPASGSGRSFGDLAGSAAA